VNNPIPLQPRAVTLVISVLVSVLGSYATLLLLGRRSSSRGWRNHLLLGVAGLCFASVAVWGMHFVSFLGVRLRASPDITWYIVVGYFLSLDICTWLLNQSVFAWDDGPLPFRSSGCKYFRLLVRWL
jgi:NO-binding membrane sensor protein with MHYT domain